MKLLTVSNPKLMKGDKLSDEYLSAIKHLSPINTRICPYQDIANCLSEDGIVVSQGESPFYEVPMQKKLMGILLMQIVCKYIKNF